MDNGIEQRHRFCYRKIKQTIRGELKREYHFRFMERSFRISTNLLAMGRFVRYSVGHSTISGHARQRSCNPCSTGFGRVLRDGACRNLACSISIPRRQSMGNSCENRRTHNACMLSAWDNASCCITRISRL